MELDQIQKEQLNKIFNENDVCLAYLFGSVAEGKEGPLSDLDFAILFSKEVTASEYFSKELRIAGAVGSLFNVDRVDVINLITTQGPLLKHNAVFGGRPLFVKNQNVRFALEHKIMQEYEDTEYLREVQYYYLKKHIKEGTFGRAQIKSKYLEKYVAN